MSVGKRRQRANAEIYREYWRLWRAKITKPTILKGSRHVLPHARHCCLCRLCFLNVQLHGGNRSRRKSPSTSQGQIFSHRNYLVRLRLNNFIFRISRQLKDAARLDLQAVYYKPDCDGSIPIRVNRMEIYPISSLAGRHVEVLRYALRAWPMKPPRGR